MSNMHNIGGGFYDFGHEWLQRQGVLNKSVSLPQTGGFDGVTEISKNNMKYRFTCIYEVFTFLLMPINFVQRKNFYTELILLTAFIAIESVCGFVLLKIQLNKNTWTKAAS